MFFCGQYLQVFDTVVSFITVDVMNMLIRAQRPFQVLLHKMPMLPDTLTAWDLDASVSIVNVAPASPVWVDLTDNLTFAYGGAFPRAVLALIRATSGNRLMERGAAGETNALCGSASPFAVLFAGAGLGNTRLGAVLPSSFRNTTWLHSKGDTAVQASAFDAGQCGRIGVHHDLLRGVMPSAIASSAGALLCLNYSIATPQMLFNWGDGGRAWIAGEHLDALIRDGGESCTATEQAVIG